MSLPGKRHYCLHVPLPAFYFLEKSIGSSVLLDPMALLPTFSEKCNLSLVWHLFHLSTVTANMVTKKYIINKNRKKRFFISIVLETHGSSQLVILVLAISRIAEHQKYRQ